ncbi:MAG: hypothetical protein SAK29_24810 [Scytonema sp. PMC 1069.18]|nr:hypothetical protein [Scytonema sp. PMC 1069.18]
MQLSVMQTHQQTLEVTGFPAQVWGNILVPTQGTMSIEVNGDTLYGIAKTGSAKKESWTRIQNIDSIEIHQSPIYALIGLGIFLVFLGLGLLTSFLIGVVFLLGGTAILFYALHNKRRYLAIYSQRTTIVIFMNESSEVYQKFAVNVLNLAQTLNMSTNSFTR